VAALYVVVFAAPFCFTSVSDVDLSSPDSIAFGFFMGLFGCIVIAFAVVTVKGLVRLVLWIYSTGRLWPAARSGVTTQMVPPEPKPEGPRFASRYSDLAGRGRSSK